MTEIKIFCPHCGQHIQCEESYRGTQINCPACKQLFLIPKARHSPPPAPPSPPPPTHVPQKQEAVFFVMRNGTKSGPYTPKMATSYLESGFLKHTDFAWCEGMADWQPLHVVLQKKGFPVPPPPSPSLATQANPNSSELHSNPITSPQMINSNANNQTTTVLTVLGLMCYGFGMVDFAGMFFHYDITGVPWSPIVAGIIGSILCSFGKNKGAAK